jgi:Flp pilus assembly protein TadB
MEAVYLVIGALAAMTGTLVLAVVSTLSKPVASESFDDALSMMTGRDANEIDLSLTKGPDEKKKGWNGFWYTEFTKSGRQIADEGTPGRVILSIIALSLFFGVFVFPGGSLGLIAPLVAVGAVYLFLTYEQGKRRATLEKQLPLVLSSLRTQMMAGVTVQGALINVADELPSPIGDEFRQVKADVSVSIPLEESLANLATRMKSRLMFFLVSSIGVAIQSGSDLIPQLVTIEEIVRQRARIEGKIKSALAFARPTAYLAMGVPLLMGVYLFATDPTYGNYFFGEGWWLLLISLAAYAGGVFLIRQIVKNVEKI